MLPLRWLLLCGICGLFAVASPLRAVQPVDTPLAGWTFNGLADHDQESEVAYPQPPIDRGGQRGRTLIRGQLAAVGADRKPYQLVVNGNPMPLYTGPDGAYVRPYAFGTGSNSIEVRDPEGKSRQRLQFYEANPNRPQARIRIILAWDDNKAEVDLHVLTPDGQHAFFAHPVLTNGGGLDVDSVDGAGPEMFSMTAPLRGNYHVYVNYWGNFNEAGYNFQRGSNQRDLITTRVTLVFNENTLHERRETFTVPLRRIGDLTHVRSFVF